MRPAFFKGTSKLSGGVMLALEDGDCEAVEPGWNGKHCPVEAKFCFLNADALFCPEHAAKLARQLYGATDAECTLLMSGRLP